MPRTSPSARMLPNTLSTRFLVLFLFSIFYFLFSFTAHAAELYFDPSSGNFGPGVTFNVDVRVSVKDECINAGEIYISYPKGELEPVDVSMGDSIFSLWIKEPAIYKEYGLISFIGGLPGGYCGRAPGDPSLTNKLATLIFRFPTSTPNPSLPPPTASLAFLDNSRLVLNDGLGTEADMKLAKATYAKIIKGSYLPENNWEKQLQADKIPPDDFKIGMYADPSLFEGNKFAVFSAVDKQTGVDHYEVSEVTVKSASLPDYELTWARAVSPYMIQNKNLDGLLKIKAVDKAGNERIASYSFAKPIPKWRQWFFSVYSYIILGSVLTLAVIGVVLKFVL